MKVRKNSTDIITSV